VPTYQNRGQTEVSLSPIPTFDLDEKWQSKWTEEDDSATSANLKAFPSGHPHVTEAS